jgi:succinate dehydrogenase flavin-adding protein (antitoxin of CptAB toxin-antitoxin module)
VPVINPTAEHFRDILSRARHELHIASPYILSTPLEDLEKWRPHSDAKLSLWTRLSPIDWRAGASDPFAVWAALDTLSERGCSTRIAIHPRLHAKIYVADRSYGLLGSSNLTPGGFGGNVEANLEVFDEQALEVVSFLESVLAKARQLDLNDLKGWVEDSEALVVGPTESDVDDAIELAEVQRQLDRLLGLSSLKPTAVTNEPDQGLMEEFIEWIDRNRGLREADMVIKRYYNHQNLSGKAKQSICSIYRFLSGRPDLANELAKQASGEGIFSPDEALRERWIEHVEANATCKSECYDYSILRGYLTPNYGGVCSGGSGGESTLKRVFPLMAAFLCR